MDSIFEAGETAEGPRVRLGAMAPADLEAMSSWVAVSLAPEWGIEDLRRVVGAGQGVLISDAAGEAIGVAVVETGGFEDGAWSPARPLSALRRAGRDAGSGRAESSAVVPFIGIAPSRRFKGLGGESGLTLERHLRSKGVEKVYAPVPDGCGLAVYFWLRLGYRPLTGSEAPWPLVGLGKGKVIGMWMVRARD